MSYGGHRANGPTALHKSRTISVVLSNVGTDLHGLHAWFAQCTMLKNSPGHLSLDLHPFTRGPEGAARVTPIFSGFPLMHDVDLLILHGFGCSKNGPGQRSPRGLSLDPHHFTRGPKGARKVLPAQKEQSSQSYTLRYPVMWIFSFPVFSDTIHHHPKWFESGWMYSLRRMCVHLYHANHAIGCRHCSTGEASECHDDGCAFLMI